MMDASLLQNVWFLLFGVLVAGYAILDGFDLGAGMLSIVGKNQAERRVFYQAIGPVWDGNEVWLLTAGGALFAAFPPVYASVFSGFYIPFMLLLVALILRAVSLEFRSKVDSDKWRALWDRAFWLGSLLPSLLFGVTVGNLLLGLPLDAGGNYTGTFLQLLHPYALILGLLSLSMFACHGGVYMAIKTEGDLQARMQSWAGRAWMAWVSLFFVGTLATFFFAPARMAGLTGNILFWLNLIVLLGALVALPVVLRTTRHGLTFIVSALAITAQIALVGISLYPNMVPAIPDAALSLTIANSSSSELTLTTMLVIALIGMPLVIGYTIFIYRVFRGKVQ